MNAGQGTIAAKGSEAIAGRPTRTVSMELATTGLSKSVYKFYDRTDTWIDETSLLPVRHLKQTREPNYAADEEVMLDVACRRFHRVENRLDKRRIASKEGRLPEDTVDILGYLVYLRGLPLKEGGQYDLTLLSGDRLWPVTVKVVRRTKISAPAGWFDTFFLEPVLRAHAADTKLKQLQVWVTADERRIPVRIRMEANVGHITAELVKID